MTKKIFTKKQMGDAGEMLVAAELTLHGNPAYIVPSNWPGYDVVAEPPGKKLQRISVKTRSYAKSGNFVGYSNEDEFDWLAIVILPGPGLDQRRIFIIPRSVAEKRSYLAERRDGRGFFVHKLIALPPKPFPRGASVPAGGWGIGEYENNYALRDVITA